MIVANAYCRQSGKAAKAGHFKARESGRGFGICRRIWTSFDGVFVFDAIGAVRTVRTMGNPFRRHQRSAIAVRLSELFRRESYCQSAESFPAILWPFVRRTVRRAVGRPTFQAAQGPNPRNLRSPTLQFQRRFQLEVIGK